MTLAVFLTLTVAVLTTATASAAPHRAVLALRHDPAAVAALEQRLEAVSDVHSVAYGEWLSADDVESLVGASSGVVEEAEAWVRRVCGEASFTASLTGQRDFLEVTSSDRTCIDALAAQWAKAVREEDLPLDGAFVAASRPRSGTPPVDRTPTTSTGPGSGMATVGPPNAQKDAYGIPLNESGTATGNLQLVWGPGTFGYLPSDLATFYSEFDVEGASTDHLKPFGYRGEVGGDNFGEATLDVTYASSMAPGVETVVANTNSSASTEETTGFGYALLSFSHLLANAGTGQQGGLPLPAVVSMSLGSLSFDSCALLCDTLAEDDSNSYTLDDCNAYMATQRQVCMYDSASVVDRINVEFLKASARGVTLLGATGDGGSHFSFGAFPVVHEIGRLLNGISCEYALPTFPAESPYVLGVGGEQWEDGGTPDAPVYWYAGGAGFSRRFPQPFYQRATVQSYLATAPLPPTASFDPTKRAYPDLVALAWGVPMVLNGTTITTGGTSASAPAMAGIVSLLNGIRLNKGLPVLGFLHPRLYAAASSSPSTMFYDITVGNSSQGGDHYDCGNGFVATSGWDAVTGWGSPRWAGLVDAFTSD